MPPLRGDGHLCVADGVLLAIKSRCVLHSKQTAFYALHCVDKKWSVENEWKLVGELPLVLSHDLDTLLLSDGKLLVVDNESGKVLKVTVKGVQDELFPSVSRPLKSADIRKLGSSQQYPGTGSVGGAEKGSPFTSGAIEDTPNLGAATSAVSTTEGDPKFKDWDRSIRTHMPEKTDHLLLQHFMSAVEVILLVHDAFTKHAVLKDLKPPRKDFKDPVSFPTRETFLGMFQGKKTALLFSGMSESSRSITKALEHYFPQATKVVTLSMCSKPKLSNAMNGDIVVPKNTQHLVWDFECDTNGRKSVIHPIGTDIDMPAKPGITTSSIRGISTKKAWIVTAAKAAVDYCKVFIQGVMISDSHSSDSHFYDELLIAQMNPLAYYSRLNMENDIPTSSSLYYLLSLLKNDFRKVFLDIVSKACWLAASPVDTEGDCSDALACITRVVGWTQCSTERSWSALISLMKANYLTTAAIEIEKCLKMIVRYTTLSEAAFLLSDADHKKAISDSETLHTKMIELEMHDFNMISVTMNQENENEKHFYYPQYMISVGVADIAKYERSVYKAAINIDTPVIVEKDIEVFVSACAPGSEVWCGGSYGTLGCCKINGTSDTYTFSTCHHVIQDLNGIQVSCKDGRKIQAAYRAGIHNSSADICLLKTECADDEMNNIVFVNDSQTVELQNFESPYISLEVFKMGARTFYTDMKVEKKCPCATVTYDDGTRMKVRDVWLLQHANLGDCPAAKGDSGSLVAIPEIDNNIVGIITAVAVTGKSALMFDFGLSLGELQSSFV